MVEIAINNVITSSTARVVLDALRGREAVTILLDSRGGSAFAGLQIYLALRQHPGNVTVIVTGIAASAASLVAMAGDKIVMKPGARLMLHEPVATVEEARVGDLKATATLLERIGRAMASAYAQRAGKRADDLAEVMKAETWFGDEEAVAFGLADEVEGKRPASIAALSQKFWRDYDRRHAHARGSICVDADGRFERRR
ncbi:ATP-dependent Clp protease proteolytic subunit [Aquamicrobium terrae]